MLNQLPRRGFRFAIVVGACFFARFAVASVGQWTALGPYDDTGTPIPCQSLAISPDGTTIYAGTDSAVYRSDDAGIHWQRFNVPTPGGIPKLLLSPGGPSVLYAGTATGFFISADRGETWRASGLSDQAVYSLAIDPQSQETIYAGGWQPVFPETGVISRSRDGGASWEPLLAHENLGPVTALAIDPIFSSSIYAAVSGAILRSRDAGATWGEVDQDHGDVFGLLIDPFANTNVFASWSATASPGGFPAAGLVRRSGDGGDNWFDLPDLPNSTVGRLIADPRSPAVLYVEGANSLWRTVDRGQHWAAIAPALYPSELLFDPNDSTTLYAAGFSGVQKLDLPSPCVPSATALCLQEGRFRVEAAWQLSPSGPSMPAQAVAVTSESGYFWFFDPENVELMVKVLDGTPVNGYFWVFYGALSDVEYHIAVTDTLTGQTKTYDNPAGTLASAADTKAFPGLDAGLSAAEAISPPSEPSAMSFLAASDVCQPDSATLCLKGGRFRVQASWQTSPSGPTIEARAVRLTGDTGYFWFFEDANVELVVKVLDGTPVNSHFWVFYGALSNVEYTITVTDTLTGAFRTYHNGRGTLASVADTTAF